jgi:hypothetical protein
MVCPVVDDVRDELVERHLKRPPLRILVVDDPAGAGIRQRLDEIPEFGVSCRVSVGPRIGDGVQKGGRHSPLMSHDRFHIPELDASDRRRLPGHVQWWTGNVLLSGVFGSSSGRSCG